MLAIAFMFTAVSPQAASGIAYICSGKPLEPQTLVRIDYAFAKDTRRVCYFDRELKGLNPNRLKVRKGGIATDGTRVFVHSRETHGTDPATLEYVGYRYYRDAWRVYLRDGADLRIIDGIDPQTFRLHGAYYTSDKSGVFWNGFRVLAADRRTFRVTSLHGAKDQYRTFLKGVSVGP
jgi:hypothetical protein